MSKFSLGKLFALLQWNFSRCPSGHWTFLVGHWTFFFFLLAAVLPAQRPCDYATLLREGRAFLEQKKPAYRKALFKFNAARTCDPTRSAEVDAAVNRLFLLIEGERDEAKRQRDKAERLSGDNIRLNSVAETERKRSDSLGIEINKRNAASSYEDRSGLLRDKIDEQSNTKIDIPYPEAVVFDYMGYTKVKKDSKHYLVAGTQFLLATEVGQLSAEVTALDLRGKGLASIPDTVFSQTQLKILLLGSNQLDALPTKIERLVNLQSLDLGNNQLLNLSTALCKLPDLQEVDFRFNPSLAKVPDCLDRFKKKENAEDWIEVAQRLHSGRIERVMGFCEQAMKLDASAAMYEKVANIYNSHCYDRLLAADGKGAETYIRRGIELAPGVAILYTYLAPALLLQGRIEEAEMEYLKWKGRPYEDRYPTYKDAFLADLKEFESKAVPLPLDMTYWEVRGWLEEK